MLTSISLDINTKRSTRIPTDPGDSTTDESHVLFGALQLSPGKDQQWDSGLHLEDDKLSVNYCAKKTMQKQHLQMAWLSYSGKLALTCDWSNQSKS